MSGPEVDFREVPPDHPDVLALAKAMGDEVSELYEDYGLGPLPDLAAYLAPGDTALVGYVEDTVATAGAVHRLDDETGEIKRMYVVPDRRRQGLSRKLLVALEGLAMNAGYTRVRLDTGKRQLRALALYRDSGYTEIPDYNGNPFASYWFEKELSGLVAASHEPDLAGEVLGVDEAEGLGAIDRQGGDRGVRQSRRQIIAGGRVRGAEAEEANTLGSDVGPPLARVVVGLRGHDHVDAVSGGAARLR